MKLTNTAECLKRLVDEDVYDDRPQAIEELATCMGSESFGYALYEGGYLKPEDWIEGEDLVNLKKAIKLVGQFKDIVESLHDEL